MSAYLFTSILLAISAMETGAGDLATPKAQHFFEYGKELGSGTAADKADLPWSDTRTLTATSENLDLTGVLKTLFGENFNTAYVVAIGIKNKSTTGALLIGGGANPAFVGLFGDGSDIAKVQPGGLLLWVAPGTSPACLTVTAGTGDILKVDAGAATIIYDIIIIARSA